MIIEKGKIEFSFKTQNPFVATMYHVDHYPAGDGGAYVMTTEDEILQARRDFRKTGFGGWPFADPEIYHSADQVRFAKHADGSIEYPNDV